MQYSFGSGVLYGRKIPLTGVATPVRFGALQGVSIDISYTTKELFGQKQFPLAIGRGTGKITGKAQFGQFNAQALNDLFFGETADPATGQTVTKNAEAQTITANVVTVTNNATFARDLGVIKAADGTPYVRVSNGPVGQQYSANESTGVYTFNSSQNNTNVKVSYQYTDAANGKTITITNQDLGSSPVFLAVLNETFNGKAISLKLNACQSSKLTMATKLEDFTIPDFDFMAFADEADVIGTLSLAE